jgi:acyl dehydratase
MALNLELAGTEWDAGIQTWRSTDAILYALGVGAGNPDPGAELAFTTENSHNVPQRVLPTFAVTIIGEHATFPTLGDFDNSKVLHAAHSVTLHGALPPAGTARVTNRLAGFYDMGDNAHIVLDSGIVDADSGVALAETTTTIFARGEGGFGGQRRRSDPWDLPARPPDHVVVYGTRPDQALLYRLSGDRNPLHSDPWLASRAGFERPILHGLCSFGFTGRALLQALCDGDPASFGTMSARFASPVVPGQQLSVHIWGAGSCAMFQARVGEAVVLDRGVFTPRQT